MTNINESLTNREQQIFSWIKQNPLISQNELAELAGISRSGIAVHISNLMKKGYIRGKGYIVYNPKYITVIGGLNIDIFGMPKNNLVNKSSNQGHIYSNVGGLGRNIALNLRKLNLMNYFISVYGNDAYGEKFKQDALENNMDIAYSEQLMNAKTSTYLYVNQPNGERIVALDDMDIINNVTPAFLAKKKEIINNGQYIVIDTNIPEKSIKWVTENTEKPIFVKVVSTTKAKRIINYLNKVDTLVINAVEAPFITGIKVTDEVSARKCAKSLMTKGVKNIFIYIDEIGMLYQNNQNTQFYPEPKINRKNTNGAGAAAISALLWARTQQLSFIDTAKSANVAAYICMESNDPVNPEMSVDLLEKQKKLLFP